VTISNESSIDLMPSLQEKKKKKDEQKKKAKRNPQDRPFGHLQELGPINTLADWRQSTSVDVF
jgi:hypothetical protein